MCVAPAKPGWQNRRRVFCNLQFKTRRVSCTCVLVVVVAPNKCFFAKRRSAQIPLLVDTFSSANIWKIFWPHCSGTLSKNQLYGRFTRVQKTWNKEAKIDVMDTNIMKSKKAKTILLSLAPATPLPHPIELRRNSFLCCLLSASFSFPSDFSSQSSNH